MNSDRSLLATFARLTVAATFPILLVAARSIYVGQVTSTFLLWNLFLAWLPLLFAALAVVLARRSLLLALVPGLAWLVFLPNAPYLVTDLMHLANDGRVPVLFDTVLLFSFALCGLALGLVSLRWMQGLVAQRWGSLHGWGFAATALGAAGFGIYLGRYGRWNSWDLLTQPSSLLRDVLGWLANPIDHWHTWAMSLLFASLLIFAYWLFHDLERS
ncbi:MAG TPA: DUF1361 domain-containing protein [Anaerolineae bacterium]|nr:DUF1361 domain-containing protein [Anaerolineae bacterium]